MAYNEQHLPPKWALRFFRWYCRSEYVEDLEGDLLERFDRRKEEVGLKKARQKFFFDVVQLFRPALIKSIFGLSYISQYSMFRNYFKVSWRNLSRQRLYSTINIGGLTIGLTAFILISLYVTHELSYDKFYKNSESIHRVYKESADGDYLGSSFSARTPAQLATSMMEEFEEVEFATTFDNYSALLSNGESNGYLEKGVFADRQFFNVFQLNFLSGNADKALPSPQSIVLTETLASKMFGSQNPMGKTVRYGETDYLVSGVIEDLPNNSVFEFSFVCSLESDRGYQRYFESAKWNSHSYLTFFTLAPAVKPAQLERRLAQLFAKHWIDIDKYPTELLVEPLSAVHLHSDINHDLSRKGDTQRLWIFSAVALIILMLACINYINLAIARSINRVKEVGVRKAIGAKPSQLMVQFLIESLLFVVLALSASLFMVKGTLPAFASIVERPFVFGVTELVKGLQYIIALALALGVIAGSYPALYIARLQTINVLKGRPTKTGGKQGILSSLVIVQYAVAIVLVISSLIIYQQFQFVQQKDLGFEQDQVVSISIRSHDIRDKYEVLKQEWMAHPGIEDITASQYLPSDVQQKTITNDDDGGSPDDDLDIYQLRTDLNFLDFYGIELIAGRDFSAQSASDIKTACLINESAVKAMGWTPEQAVGQRFTENWLEEGIEVIGVVKDFHLHSLHLPIEPLMLDLTSPRRFKYLSVRIHKDKIPETLAHLEQQVKQYSSYPFDYQFLDDQIDQLYKADINQGKILATFTGLAILIASLGLFGMTAFRTEQRKKEISIRKILGASLANVVTLFTNSIMRQTLIGFVVAVPLAILVMNKWLESFTYKTELSWWLFALSGILIMSLVLFTVGIQTLQAARANPVDALKNE
ncbi:MAG: ABC transporter permease [Bacteroidota bacterium]